MAVAERLRSAWNALRSAPANPQRTSSFFFGGRAAGIHVTPEIAFQVSAVWACIDVISSAIAASNWNVHEWLAQDKQSFLYNDPLQDTLNTRFNPEMTAKSAKQALMIAAVSAGNGYAEIVRDLTGRARQLWPIAPDRVTPFRDADGLYYRVTNEGADHTYLDPMDVFHVRGPGINGLFGDNQIGKAVRTIALAIAQERFAETYFANNAQLGLIVKSAAELDDVHYERLKSQIAERHKGADRAHRTLLLENVTEVDRDTVEADKTQMVEARNQQVEEICRWFRVPPHKIQRLVGATLNNIEHQGLEFARDTLRPWKVEIEQEAEYKLFAPSGRTRFVVVDTAWASQGDFKTRMEGYQIGRGMGAYSVNDILRKEGENTIGKEGDLRIVNGASIPLDRVGENYTSTQPASQPQPTEGPNAPPKPATRAVMQAWLATIYSRAGKRYENRKADLERAGRNDASAVASADAREYLAGQLGELAPHLEAWAGRDVDCREAGVSVLAGRPAEEAAAEVIASIEQGNDE